MKILKIIIHDEGGQTTTEYGLLLGMLAMGIIIPITGMRDGLRGVYGGAQLALTDAIEGFIPSEGCDGE